MKPFTRFVLARGVCWSGNTITLVALPLLVYQHSESALLSGAVFAVESLPYLLFGLFAGAYADRLDRRSVLVVTQLLSGLALAGIPLAQVMGTVSVPHTLVVAFAVSTLFVFYDAAAFGVVPALVGRDRIAQATATLVSTGTVVGIVGPLLGGVAATTFSPATAIAIDALCYLVAAALTVTITVPATNGRTPAGRSLSRQITEGLEYIWQHRAVRSLTLVGIGVSMANGVVAGLMIVAGVERIGLHHNDARIGALYASTALGALVISLFSARIQAAVSTGLITLAGIVIAAITVLMWSQVTSLVPALMILMIYQAANTLVVVNGIVVRQSITPDRLQSRVNTTARMVAMGGTPVGAAVGGAIAQVTDVRWALAMGALALLVSALLGITLGVAHLPRLAELTTTDRTGD